MTFVKNWIRKGIILRTECPIGVMVNVQLTTWDHIQVFPTQILFRVIFSVNNNGVIYDYTTI